MSVADTVRERTKPVFGNAKIPEHVSKHLHRHREEIDRHIIGTEQRLDDIKFERINCAVDALDPDSRARENWEELVSEEAELNQALLLLKDAAEGIKLRENEAKAHSERERRQLRENRRRARAKQQAAQEREILEHQIEQQRRRGNHRQVAAKQARLDNLDTIVYREMLCQAIRVRTPQTPEDYGKNPGLNFVRTKEIQRQIMNGEITFETLPDDVEVPT